MHLNTNMSLLYRSLNKTVCSSRASLSILNAAKQPWTLNVRAHSFKNIFQPSAHHAVKEYNSLFRKYGIHPLLGKFSNDDATLRWITSSSSHLQQSGNNGGNNTDNSGKQDNEDGDKKDKIPMALLIGWIVMSIGSLLVLQMARKSQAEISEISWNDFFNHFLSKGEVDKILVTTEEVNGYYLAVVTAPRGAVLNGQRLQQNKNFIMRITSPDSFETKVRQAEAALGIKPEKGVPISYRRKGEWEKLIVPVIVGIFALSVLYSLRGVTKNMPSNMMDPFSSVKKAKFIRADKLTTAGNAVGFKDVAGLHEAKVEIMEFVDYLKKPDRFKKLGAKVPKGALLTGPPGCGKTLLARAVSAEAEVPFLVMAGSEFVEMIGGLGAARVRDLFKEARDKAPCIIYIDEIDAIGKKRQGNNFGSNTEEEHTLNQLLVEMDGMGTVEGVILLASTNREDVLDQALLRPGRFDRHVIIDLPTLAERKETFEMYLSKMKTIKPATAYSERLSQMSPGMSGADIANVCNEAALFAARHQKSAIDASDFDYAVERMVAGVAKKSGLLSVQEKKIVAYHEAGHALVGWMQTEPETLLKVSIVPRTNATLGFAQYMPKDQHLYSEEQLFGKMCNGLGGRVAESLTFNRVTDGAQDDLKNVTDLAYKQVRTLGMNDAVGPLSFDVGKGNEFGGKPYSKKLATLIDMESQKLVAKAYQVTEKLIQDNKDKLKLIAEALLEKEVLHYEDLVKLIGPPPHSQTPHSLFS